MCIMNLLGMSAYIDVPPYFNMKTNVLGSQDQQRNIHPLPVRCWLNGLSVLFLAFISKTVFTGLYLLLQLATYHLYDIICYQYVAFL
jgi:hypothetical protein